MPLWPVALATTLSCPCPPWRPQLIHIRLWPALPAPFMVLSRATHCLAKRHPPMSLPDLSADLIKHGRAIMPTAPSTPACCMCQRMPEGFPPPLQCGTTAPWRSQPVRKHMAAHLSPSPHTTEGVNMPEPPPAPPLAPSRLPIGLLPSHEPVLLRPPLHPVLLAGSQRPLPGGQPRC
jgi:hypothetical protein